jgi:hypothetical protein
MNQAIAHDPSFSALLEIDQNMVFGGETRVQKGPDTRLPYSRACSRFECTRIYEKYQKKREFLDRKASI